VSSEVRQTEPEALGNLTAVLQLCAAGTSDTEPRHGQPISLDKLCNGRLDRGGRSHLPSVIPLALEHLHPQGAW